MQLRRRGWRLLLLGHRWLLQRLLLLQLLHCWSQRLWPKHDPVIVNLVGTRGTVTGHIGYNVQIIRVEDRVLLVVVRLQLMDRNTAPVLPLYSLSRRRWTSNRHKQILPIPDCDRRLRGHVHRGRARIDRRIRWGAGPRTAQ